MKDTPLYRLTILWIGFCITAGVWAQANPPQPPEDPNNLKLEMNFRDVPLQTVVEYLSEKTGLIILSNDGLDQRLSVISRDPVNLNEAIELINSVLKEGGYAAIRQGRTLRIVPQEEAIKHTLPIYKGSDPNKVTASDSMEYRIVPVRYRDVTELVDNLQALMPSYATLQANKEGNVLLITDTAANIKRLLKIISMLDVPMSATAEIEVFQLHNADAASVAEVINQLFQETSQGSSSNQRGGRNPFQMMMGGRGGRGGRGGFGGGGDNNASDSSTSESGRGYVAVTAAADTQTNSVVVSGPHERMEVIRQVVQGLDTRASELAGVKVFHLEYADAQNTAELINDVFGLTGTSRSSRNQQQSNNRRFGFGGRGGGGQQDTSTSSSNATVIASSDTRTNSVVVSGPPDTLEVIAGIVKELDSNPEEERRIFNYPLQNASATNLMTILNDLFAQMQSLQSQGTGRNNQQFRGGGAGGGGQTTSSSSSDSGGLDEETYFQADPNTNTLLTMTSSKNYTKIKPIIDELDKPVGQVLIKVLFAEVTYSDSVDLGAEFALLDLNRNGGTQTVDVFGRPTDLTTPGAAGSALGAGTTGSTGLSVRTVQGDLDLTLHALQESGRLNVLSRPYVFARNNQKATITVADEVPIPSSSTSASAGGGVGTQTSFTYRDDIGIVLEVTPSVNNQGLVNMVVSPKITTQSGTVQIAENLNAVQFSTRSATTRVAVKDGQTIVIGGLIQDKINDTIKKVPLLGDIPIAGALFRRTVKEKSKTELLIFLTPYVAKEPEDMTPISNFEKNESSLNTDALAAELFKKHMQGMEGLTHDPNQTSLNTDPDAAAQFKRHMDELDNRYSDPNAPKSTQ